jgi:hypothetical protein
MMNAVMNMILEMLKMLWSYVLQYGYVAYYWLLKLIKVQTRNWNRCASRKQLEKSFSGLGGEIYALYKQGVEADWPNVPMVQQQIKQVEEAESRVFQVDDLIEAVKRDFESKKEEVKAKYTAKRAETAKPPEDEPLDD